MNKKFVRLSVLVYWCFSSLSAYTLEESRLWLPTNHEPLRVKLIEAARAAKKLDKCEQVLSGTLDLDQSTAQHPIFRILCRKSDGKTYNEMVDGLSNETLSTLQGDKAVLNRSQLAQLRKTGPRRVVATINKQISLLWPVCESAIVEQTRQMINVKRYMEGQSDPVEYRQQQSIFSIDVDAEDPDGTQLYYRVVCTIRSQSDFDLQIRPRGVNK